MDLGNPYQKLLVLIGMGRGTWAFGDIHRNWQVWERAEVPGCHGAISYRYRAMYQYRPQNEDELELREGDRVDVMQQCDDGWFVGMWGWGMGGGQAKRVSQSCQGIGCAAACSTDYGLMTTLLTLDLANWAGLAPSVFLKPAFLLTTFLHALT
jgi:hypothetical protein